MKSLLKFALPALFLLTATSLQAQRPKVGLYANLGMTTVPSWRNAEPGARGGISIQVPLSPSIAIRTEAGINLVREKARTTTVVSSNELTRTTVYNAFNFAEISPVVVIRQDRKLNFLVGAYASFLMSKNGFVYQIHTLNNTSRDYAEERNGTFLYPRLDGGLRAGAAYTIQPGVTVQLMYSQGLRNFTSISPMPYRYLVRGIYAGVHVMLGKPSLPTEGSPL